MAKVELKQPVVNEIKELLTDAQSGVLVLDLIHIWKMRSSMI